MRFSTISFFFPPPFIFITRFSHVTGFLPGPWHFSSGRGILHGPSPHPSSNEPTCRPSCLTRRSGAATSRQSWEPRQNPPFQARVLLLLRPDPGREEAVRRGEMAVGDLAFKALTAGLGVATLYLAATFSVNVYRGLSWHSEQSVSPTPVRPLSPQPRRFGTFRLPAHRFVACLCRIRPCPRNYRWMSAARRRGRCPVAVCCCLAWFGPCLAWTRALPRRFVFWTDGVHGHIGSFVQSVYMIIQGSHWANVLTSLLKRIPFLKLIYLVVYSSVSRLVAIEFFCTEQTVVVELHGINIFVVQIRRFVQILRFDDFLMFFVISGPKISCFD